MNGTAGGVPPIDISSFLPVSATSTIVIQAQDAGGFIGSSSLYLVTNCTSGSVTQPIPTDNPNNINLPADFSNGGNTLTTTIDYFAPGGLNFPNGVTSPVLITTNTTVPAGTWPEYVVGTPWATSQCTVKAANGSATLCSIFMNACFQSGGNPSTASDANCPTVAKPDDNNLIILQDTFDWGNGKWIPSPGLTASLIAFTPPLGVLWSPSLTSTNDACPTVVSTTPAPCYLSDSLIDIFGDQTTTRGSKPKSKAWLASAVNVPMLTSSINLTAPNNTITCPATLNAPPANNNGFAATIWSNGACILDFVVSPPPPTNSNYFQAAEPSFLEYGTAQGNVGPPPFTPGALPAGDQTINNPNPVLTCVASVCTATTWVAGPHQPLSSIFNANNGTFTLHWSAKDTAGITEKSIVLLDGSSSPCTPEEALSRTCNYFTSYFTTVVNIDSVYPTVSLTFNPAGGVYSAGQSVSATFTCTDLHLASCTATLDSNPFTPGANILTTAGKHSITVTGVDLAGNTTTQTFPYQVLADADVAVFEQETSDRVKPGNSLTYITWALDLSKTDAAEVTLNEQIQLPANGSVHLGNVTASVAVVSCSLSGCTTSMPAGTSCSVSGTSITCNIGTLPSLLKLKGAVVKTVIPVASNSVVGSTFKITATVNSPNDPNPRNNSTSDLITVTSK